MSSNDFEGFAALKALHRKPFAVDKTPKELFAPDEVYREATQDRAVALVAATNLDMTLEHAIKSRLVTLNSDENDRLFGPDAPIGTFSARIKIGYALGIYERKFRSDLDTIRLIRNVFGHVQSHVDFETPEIAAACGEIRIIKRNDPADWDARRLYIWSAMKLCMHLYFGSTGERDRLTDATLYAV